MAFRADEAARAGLGTVLDYLVPRAAYLDEAGRARSREAVHEIADRLGPVVDAYPSWHTLVRNYKDDRSPATTPGSECGYHGLDHTKYFANGFVTCPYDDGQKVLDSVANLPYHPSSRLSAERLDEKLYNQETTPVFLQCVW